VDHWFKSEVQDALTALTEQIDRVSLRANREALQVALSSIIVRVSNQESDTRYAAIEKDTSAEHVFRFFSRAVASLSQALQAFFGDPNCHRGTATVLHRNTLQISPAEIGRKVGLVITSPPYPNAYEYWLYHKYRMYWLGMDPLAVRAQEIGARAHYFGGNRQDEHDFEDQMGACFRLLSNVMLPEARACFLIGRSIIQGRVIDNAALLHRASRAWGFALEDVIERAIPTTRKAFNPTHGKINLEHLMVFRMKRSA